MYNQSMDNRHTLNIGKTVVSEKRRKKMSYAYQQRKKAIKRYKRANPEKVDRFGHIKRVDFGHLQDTWQRQK